MRSGHFLLWFPYFPFVALPMGDLGLVVLVLELFLLCACASPCASDVVIPAVASPPQDLSGSWRRVSNVAAAAAAAAAEEVCPSLSPQTVQFIQIAARAATAATASALRDDPLELSTAPWWPPPSLDGEGAGTSSAGTAAIPPSLRGRRAIGQGQGGVGARGRGAGRGGRGGAGRGAGVARGGIGRPVSREGRKPRTSIPLGDKIALIDIKDAGYTWAHTLDMFRLHISTSTSRNVYRNKDEYRRRAAAAEDLSAPRLRRSYFDSISQFL